MLFINESVYELKKNYTDKKNEINTFIKELKNIKYYYSTLTKEEDYNYTKIMTEQTNSYIRENVKMIDNMVLSKKNLKPVSIKCTEDKTIKLLLDFDFEIDLNKYNLLKKDDFEKLNRIVIDICENRLSSMLDLPMSNIVLYIEYFEINVDFNSNTKNYNRVILNIIL